MAFIVIEESLRYFISKDILYISPEGILYLYPIKVLVVGGALIFFWARYSEIRAGDVRKLTHTAASILIGIVVFILWVNMDWPFAIFGTLQGYDPAAGEYGMMRNALIASRLLGAVVVVPVMEELFWRSFLIRYMINPKFSEVPIGQFSWASFVAITILFGLEHNLWLAGMMAGAAYNLVLYYTRSIMHCIFAHAVTNLALGIYILQTGQTKFW